MSVYKQMYMIGQDEYKMLHQQQQPPPASQAPQEPPAAIVQPVVAAAASHVCLVCGKMFTDRLKLKYHRRTHSSKNKKKNKVPPVKVQDALTCPEDGRVFPHPHLLAHHMKRVHGPGGKAGQSFVCNICGDKEVSQLELDKHLRMAHVKHGGGGGRKSKAVATPPKKKKSRKIKGILKFAKKWQPLGGGERRRK